MIPVCEPLIGEREKEYVAECLRTGWISSSGRFIEEFERRWAAYCGMEHGIAVSNGSVALDAALECLGLQAGDEIILPSFTIISCAWAIIRSGARPVLVDCDPETWCMDVDQVAARLTSRTRAVMPVHIYGHPVDMDPLLRIAEENGLVVIEDAAEAHGAEYLSKRSGRPEWRRCGGFGHLSTFSFYANKIVTSGEGGMVLTNDAAQAEKLRRLRNLGFIPERRFWHEHAGHNFRLTNLQAAVGLAQVERIDEALEKKRWLGRRYTEVLANIPGLQLPVEKTWARNVYWMYGVVIDPKTGMDAVACARRLRDAGIDTRPFFLGMHEQPALRRLGLFQGEAYPVADHIARQGLYLPSGLTVDESQVQAVAQALRGVIS